MSKLKKNITIDDVAKLAKVSKATISRYLNGKFEYMSSDTKDRIEKIIKKYNYKPSSVARSLKTKNTNLIGFVVSDIQKSFVSPLIKSMSKLLSENKFHMITTSSDGCLDQEQKSIESLVAQQVDAIFLNPVSYTESKIEDLNIDIPVILIEDNISSQVHDIVFSDSHVSMKEAIEHLKRYGYSDIYLFGYKSSNQILNNKREVAFRNIMLSYGYADNVEGLIIQIDTNNIDDIKRNILKLSKEKHTIPAIIAIDDTMLLSSLSIVNELNIRLPYDLGLLGYNDLGLDSNKNWLQLSSVEVTTLEPNWHELAKEAVKLMQHRLTNPEGLKKFIVTEVILKPKKSTKLKTDNF